MKNTIKDLIEISQYAGNRVDYTQGGGGNTSVKGEGGIMLIKASGFRLTDIAETTGFVAVDGQKIRDYYSSVDLSVEKDYEKESAEVSKSSTIALDGIQTLRPSVEVGFHAILKKYVIHTHSVYANLLTCAIRGEELASKIFDGADFGYVFLPYINPGFTLTLKMSEAIDGHKNATSKYPEVIFMKNHGLVVTADSIDRVVALHTFVNERIRNYFNLADDFRTVTLVKNDDLYVSKTPVVKAFVEKYGLSKDFLDEYPLYPDQLVYLNNILAHAPEKMSVVDGTVCYKTELKEAQTLEETLSAYVFIISTLKDKELEISTMSEKEVYFINNWEAEKYRRSVAK